jgi:peroxiredoxin
MRSPTLCLAGMLVLAPFAMAQSSKAPTPSTPRPVENTPMTPQPHIHIFGQVSIGERTPDFTLDGSDGRPLRLVRYRGDWVLMVFADRKETLAPLADIDGDMRSLGVRIVGVCREKAHGLQIFAARGNLPFLLGADFSGEVSELFGQYDRERTTVNPGFLLLDREGVVRMAVLGQNVPPEQIADLVRFAVTGL